MEHQLTDGQLSKEQEELVHNAVDSMLTQGTYNYRSVQLKLEANYSIKLTYDETMDIVDNRMAMQ